MRDDAGFTLLELLVAITLLGLLTLVLTGSLRLGTRAWERVEAAAVDEMPQAHALLRRHLERAYPLYLADGMRPQVAFWGEADHLTFLAPSPGAVSVGGFARFSLRAVRRENALALILAARPELAREDSAIDEEVATGLRAVSFQYLGDDGWQRRWNGRSALPRLIRLRLEGTEPWPDLVVAPQVTDDALCVYNPVTRYCQGRS